MNSARETYGSDFAADGRDSPDDFEKSYLDAPQPISDTVGPSNIGFKMLQKFGWKGNGLGKKEQGITVPVTVAPADSTLGVGKATEYENSIVEVTRDRKKMDVEIIQTEEITQKKKEATERQDLLEIDLKKMTQEFYCESCDKRYKTVSEMSNHLSSYDHHHRKRFKEMKDIAKKRKRGFAIGESDEVRKDEIRKKEEKREAKELQMRVDKANALQQQQQQQQQQQFHSLPPPPPPPYSSSSSSSSANQVPNPIHYSNTALLSSNALLLSTSSSSDHFTANPSSKVPHPPYSAPYPPPMAPKGVIGLHEVTSTQHLGNRIDSIEPAIVRHTLNTPTVFEDVCTNRVIIDSSFSTVGVTGSSAVTNIPPMPPVPPKPIVMKFNFSMKKK